MKVNKKLLQQYLSSTTGKVVTLKDISDIQSTVNAADHEDSGNLDALVNCLRENEGIIMYNYNFMFYDLSLLSDCRYISFYML